MLSELGGALELCRAGLEPQMGSGSLFLRALKHSAALQALQQPIPSCRMHPAPDNFLI